MEYIIGAGAMLEAGDSATITPAVLHARVDEALAAIVSVSAVDFEGTDPTALRRLLVTVKGWNAARFRTEVSETFLARRDCSLADIFVGLAQAAGVSDVHLFAHWLPDEATARALEAAGIRITVHPLEVIDLAALIFGQRNYRWSPRAA